MPGKQLSIIIVAYNALPYLDLTIRSALQSIAHLNAEIIVVDNDSYEPVSDYVTEHFPEVKLITSVENLGFGMANNLAVAKSSGDMILFLNPDTVISKEVIDGAIEEFSKGTKLGAAGLRMINGNGDFLPESKRSVPSLWSSFCRISGLSSLFPGSRIFSSYRMGHISEHSNSEVEILSGACMFIRVKEESLKLFDPEFFMYGEDIDLSYRIGKAGYDVKYLGENSIVHFKGESTNKRSWNFHYWFYKTMWMFRRKHFTNLFNQLSNIILIPLLWVLTLTAFIKNRLFGSTKGLSFKIGSYAIIGSETPNLKKVLNESFGEIATVVALKADLLIINVANENIGETIALIDNKEPNQKVMFWNEEMKLLFGSFDKNQAGINMK